MTSKLLHSWAWLTLIAAIIPIALGIRHRLKTKKQRDWIAVPGTIIRSEVEHSGELYTPRVTYHYEIGTHLFSGNVVKSGLVSHGTSWAAKDICKRYSVRAKVQVYVDPLDPSQAVLEPGGDLWFPFLMGFFGAFFLWLTYMFLTH